MDVALRDIVREHVKTLILANAVVGTALEGLDQIPQDETTAYLRELMNTTMVGLVTVINLSGLSEAEKFALAVKADLQEGGWHGYTGQD